MNPRTKIMLIAALTILTTIPTHASGAAPAARSDIATECDWDWEPVDPRANLKEIEDYLLAHFGSNIGLVTAVAEYLHAKGTTVNPAGKCNLSDEIKSLLCSPLCIIKSSSLDGEALLPHLAHIDDQLCTIIIKASIEYVTKHAQETSSHYNPIEYSWDKLFHSACSHGKIELATYLLDHNLVTIDCRSNYSENIYNEYKIFRYGFDDLTGLHFACLSGETAIVKFLLDRGANSRALSMPSYSYNDSDGHWTPLAFAKAHKQDEIVDLIEEHRKTNPEQHNYNEYHYEPIVLEDDQIGISKRLSDWVSNWFK